MLHVTSSVVSFFVNSMINGSSVNCSSMMSVGRDGPGSFYEDVQQTHSLVVAS